MTSCTRPAPLSRKASCQAVAFALLRATQALSVFAPNEDREARVDIVRKALSWPARQIALMQVRMARSSSARSSKGIPTASVSTRNPASTSTYVDKGIIDPTKVVRAALQGAASVAGWPSPPRRWSPSCGEGEPSDAGRRRHGVEWAEWTIDRAIHSLKARKAQRLRAFKSLSNKPSDRSARTGIAVLTGKSQPWCARNRSFSRAAWIGYNSQSVSPFSEGTMYNNIPRDQQTGRNSAGKAVRKHGITLAN